MQFTGQGASPQSIGSTWGHSLPSCSDFTVRWKNLVTPLLGTNWSNGLALCVLHVSYFPNDPRSGLGTVTGQQQHLQDQLNFRRASCDARGGNNCVTHQTTTCSEQKCAGTHRCKEHSKTAAGYRQTRRNHTTTQVQSSQKCKQNIHKLFQNNRAALGNNQQECKLVQKTQLAHTTKQLSQWGSMDVKTKTRQRSFAPHSAWA